MPEIITYTSGGISIRAESYAPAKPANGAAVVIAHGSDGVTDHLNGPWASMMREFATDFAGRGFAVLLPYYFDRTGTEPGIPAMQSMFGHMAAWQEALADAVTFAGRRVALVGFSLGGHLSLRLRGSVPVVVEFFAPFLTGLGPAPAVLPHVQIHHGEADRLVDIANAEQIASVLKEEGATADLRSYHEAGHGFGGGKPGDAEARRVSRERAVTFLSAHV
ncbi:MAG: dienelactone hydrolase family protein [Bryobacteraceae bacterium]|nr:dienelactone hydrolase family protein [Bryobacteraceae bacterium]